MLTEVFVRGVTNGSDLREYAQQVFDSALQRHEGHVRRVVVRLEDETGPNQHRVDKVCCVDVQLNGGDVRIREVGADFRPVIDVAVDRMRTAVGKQINRGKRGIAEG